MSGWADKAREEGRQILAFRLAYERDHPGCSGREWVRAHRAFMAAEAARAAAPPAVVPAEVRCSYCSAVVTADRCGNCGARAAR